MIGNYQLIRKLGEGGMGAVYLGQHTLLGRRAAIKVLLPALSARPDVVNRFFNEARAVTSISDPGIVQVFDFGYHSDGSAFIVMEFLEGEPLDQRLAKLRRLPVPEALRLCRQIATSLAAAHAQHIVHRDLKPENIFLVRDAEVASGERCKILDFGIAKLSDDHPGKIKTHTGTLMGTPVYMSPEQCRGVADIDHRSDIYSLGCVLYLLLTGRPPFDGEGMGDIISAHIREPVTPPSAIAGGIAPAIDALVLRCLAKAPAERFATMTELAAAIGGMPAPLSSRNSFEGDSETRSANAPHGGGYVAAAPGSAPTGAPGSALSYPAQPMPTPAPHLAAAAAPTTLGTGAAQIVTGAPRRSRVGLWISAGLIAAAAVVGIVVVSGGRGGDRAVAAASEGAAAAVVAVPSPPPPATTPPAPAAPAAPAPAAPALATADTAATDAAAAPPAPVAKPDPSKKPRTRDRAHRAAAAAAAPAATPPPPPPPATTTPAGPPPSPPPPLPAATAHPASATGKCSKSDFATVYDAAAPAPAVVRGALRNLKQCREAGAITDAEFERYQSALVAKL